MQKLLIYESEKRNKRLKTDSGEDSNFILKQLNGNLG
jgi:hypothetical protein